MHNISKQLSCYLRSNTVSENYHTFRYNGSGVHSELYYNQITDYVFNSATYLRCIFDTTFKTNTTWKKFHTHQVYLHWPRTRCSHIFLSLLFLQIKKKQLLLSSTKQSHQNQHEQKAQYELWSKKSFKFSLPSCELYDHRQMT